MRALAKKLREIRATKRRRYRMEGGTVWSSSTAYARGGREQGVHLLETCSFYPLLIERSALGSTGVDWTHQQPLSVAPSRRSPPPTRLIYVRMCVCVCVCVCVCAHETREHGSQKTPQNAAPREGWSSRGWLVRFQRVPPGRPFLVWVSYMLVCVLARTQPYWTLDIERRWSSGRWTAQVARNMKFSYMISIVKRTMFPILSSIFRG